MNNLAVLPVAPPSSELYLGPARVIAAEGSRLEVALPDGTTITAELALAYAYDPEPGDVVLVIGRHDGHYAIGVLEGTGTARLRFAGDVELSSERGSVRVRAARGVEIDADEVELRSNKLRTIAREAVSRLGSLVQSVSGLLSTSARRSHTVIAESAHTQAKDCTIVTERQVRINGKAIHLG